MPTYEYACTSCGQHLEVVQSFKDEPLTTCPHCSGTLRKVFTPIGVVFKGSGFYKTDSRGTEHVAGAGVAKEPATKEAATSGGGGGSSSNDSSSSGSSSPTTPSSAPASTGSGAGSVAAAS